MATVQLKNIKKIYPFDSGKARKASRKKQSDKEKAVNLQVTDQGVVAVLQS